MAVRRRVATGLASPACRLSDLTHHFLHVRYPFVMTPAVFLDRDNTLIAGDGDLGDPNEVGLLQGAASAVASLRGLGFAVVVITNQGGVARGQYGEKDVEACNSRLNELIHQTSGACIDRFYYCPYHPHGNVPQYKREHPWRKPGPGMILQGADDLDIDLTRSWTIGDQLRDVQAGVAAGTRTILLYDGPDAPSGDPAVEFVAKNLVEAVRIIRAQPRPTVRVSCGVASQSQQGVTADIAAQSAPAPVAPETPASTSSPIESPPATTPPPTESVPEPTALPDPVEQSPVIDIAASAGRPDIAESDEDADDPLDGASNKQLLRQIVNELRIGRADATDFSAMAVTAIVVQLLAGLCLLTALLLGHGDQSLFFKLIGAGIMLQLATVVMLMLRR